MSPKILILPDKSALISKALAVVREKIEQAIKAQNRCTIALAGGNTPKPLYAALAKTHLPWSKIQVFWGDERYVEPQNPQSNQKMARDNWLDLVPIPPENIHPMPTGSENPETDAASYAQEISSFFAVSPSIFPNFDLILLGMGDDAHTASLFPQTAALTVGDRLITVGEKDGEPRLTFTVPLINAAHCVIFLVSGTNKQTALQQVWAPDADGSLYPASLIQPQGELWWFLDHDAGATLEIPENSS